MPLPSGRLGAKILRSHACQTSWIGPLPLLKRTPVFAQFFPCYSHHTHTHTSSFSRFFHASYWPSHLQGVR